MSFMLFLPKRSFSRNFVEKILFPIFEKNNIDLSFFASDTATEEDICEKLNKGNVVIVRQDNYDRLMEEKK